MYLYNGSGMINTLIDKLPFELHLPGYQYCGPGTKLEKRLARGDRGINKLDQACRDHDIEYAKNKNLNARHVADKILENVARERMHATDAKIGEKISARLVAGAMKAKRKFGMGLTKRPSKSSRASKKSDSTKNKKTRILPIPNHKKKKGGLLPLLPLLGVLATAAGSAASIGKAIKSGINEKAQLEELKRHNRAKENLMRSTTGKGIKISNRRSRRKGKGLYLRKQNPKN